ncbi:MAG: NAD/NADP octopine/nopaline dehydrogenase family protein, partial [Candidatus Bipolaricaulota bacterium]
VSEWLSASYGVTGASLLDAIHSNPAYRTIEAPATLQHRYLFEEIPTSLVPLVALATLAGVDCPLSGLLIDLGGSLCGIDFRARGRTLKRMGLDGLSVAEVRRRVRA